MHTDVYTNVTVSLTTTPVTWSISFRELTEGHYGVSAFLRFVSGIALSLCFVGRRVCPLEQDFSAPKLRNAAR